MSNYEIDVQAEKVLPISDIPATLERMGFKRPHINVVRRWSKRGLAGIPMPTIRLGLRLYTTIGALTWWLAASTAASRTSAEPAAPQGVTYPMTPQERRVLTKAGLL